MAKSKIRRIAHKKRRISLPAFLPGMRGASNWHTKEQPVGGGTLNQLGIKGTFSVPLDDSIKSSLTRIHEALHAAHSPVEAPRDIGLPTGEVLYKDYIILAEENRINAITRSMVNYKTFSSIEEQVAYIDKFIQAYMISGSPEDFLIIIKYILVVWNNVAFTNDDIITLIRNLLRYPDDADGKEIELRDDLIYACRILLDGIINGTQIESHLKESYNDIFRFGDIPSWEWVLQIGKFLQDEMEYIKEALTSPPTPPNNSIDPDEEDADFKQFERTHHLNDEKQPLPENSTMRQRINIIKDNARKSKLVPKAEYLEDEPVWGKMKERKAAMPFRLPKKLVSKSKYNATDEGAVPRYIHRYPVDGKIFGRKKRTPGGSVLIDNSGSMDLSQEQLKEIVEAAPAVKIAMYSGDDKSGELVHIADDGKYADLDKPESRSFGFNNLVDLPALKWLSQQTKPRIWVSDTMVTVISGSPQIAAKQAFDICKKNDINIVPDAHAAHEVFNGKRAIYR